MFITDRHRQASKRESEKRVNASRRKKEKLMHENCWNLIKQSCKTLFGAFRMMWLSAACHTNIVFTRSFSPIISDRSEIYKCTGTFIAGDAKSSGAMSRDVRLFRFIDDFVVDGIQSKPSVVDSIKSSNEGDSAWRANSHTKSKHCNESRAPKKKKSENHH